MRGLGTLVFMLGVSGCATAPYNLSSSGQKDPHLQVFEDRGISSLVSSQSASTVKMTAYHTSRHDLMMNLEFENLSAEIVDIDPRKFQVFGISASGKRKKLRIYEPNEFAAKTQGRLRSSGFMVDLLDVAMQVGGGFASAAVSGAGQAIGAGQQVLQAGVTPRMRSNQSTEGEWANGVYQVYLRPSGILPGPRFGGTLISEGGSADKYEVRIPVGKELHVFNLDRPPRSAENMRSIPGK